MAATMNVTASKTGVRAFNAVAKQTTRKPLSVVASSKVQNEPARSFLKQCGLTLSAAAISAATFLSPLQDMPADAYMLSAQPISNAQAILRYALPIDNKTIREVQRDLESIAEALRIPGSKSLGPVQKSVSRAQSILKDQREKIMKDIAPERKEDAVVQLAKLDTCLKEFQVMIEAKDKQNVPIKQREALSYVGMIEQDMVKAFPYDVPAEYSSLPQLKGRAFLEAEVAVSNTSEGAQKIKLQIVLDGYNAPVSAGNFMDLVLRKFYDGMDVQRADGFVVQTGDPEGPSEGFVDPATNEIRRVPFEVMVTGDKNPVYDFTLEDLGRYNEQPVLPFNAYGTMAIARSEFDNNSGSSQVFFLLKESELTPSGANLLDGRYAVFGYVVEGQDYLGNMKVGDKINYIKVVGGEENLINSAVNK